MAFLWLRESQQKEKETGVSARILCKDCTAQDKIDRGCNGGVEYKLGEYIHDGCPEKLITEDFLTCFNVWNDWKIFKDYEFPGGRGDQPMWVLDSIRILEMAARSK